MAAENSPIKKETLSDHEDNNYDGDELMSLEKLDRESPDQWPEKSLHAFVSAAETPIRTSKAEWTRGLNKEDIAEMLKLAAMSPHELVMEIKKINDDAYRLGVCEAREMSRGKVLGIFNKKGTK